MKSNKNIQILPTSQPSRLFNCFGKLDIGEYITTREGLQVTNQHIYITSTEEIKVGDYYYLPRTNSVHKCVEDPTELNLEIRLGIAKIILTTDQDLTKDSVQAIDDEFLEWFVKNPSCEEVQLEVDLSKHNGQFQTKYGYKIIIPKQEQKQHLINMMKSDEELGLYDEFRQICECTDECLGYLTKVCKKIEEPKQETLEEVDENKKNLYYYKQIMNPYPVEEYSYTAYEKGFVDGYEKASKWQEKQDKKMYSEEDLREAFESNYDSQNYGNSNLEDDFKELLEQFKKK